MALFFHFPAVCSDCQVFGFSPSVGGGGFRQLSGTEVMPDFCGDGDDLPGSGFRQPSGTKVMPDCCGDGAAIPGTAGTTVRAWQAGQGICRPAYWGSHSRRCPQWEQLNLRWLIRLSSLPGRIIAHEGCFINPKRSALSISLKGGRRRRYCSPLTIFTVCSS